MVSTDLGVFVYLLGSKHFSSFRQVQRQIQSYRAESIKRNFFENRQLLQGGVLRACSKGKLISNTFWRLRLGCLLEIPFKFLQTQHWCQEELFFIIVIYLEDARFQTKIRIFNYLMWSFILSWRMHQTWSNNSLCSEAPTPKFWNSRTQMYL